MDNPLTLKLERFVRFSDRDRAALDGLARVSVRTLDARQDMIAEGDQPMVVNVMLEGWACRYKTLEDGRRQIFIRSVRFRGSDMRSFLDRFLTKS